MSDAAEDDALESLVGQVADEFLRRLQQGESPNVAEYEARYPDAAPLLRNVLASLQLFDRSAPAGVDHATEAPAPGTLGDFRIVREVGRGGMGIVYEAEQISLGRRVALKVLPLAATLDGRQLQRFKNEAQSAAQLHHPNIVPVHSVGCERGVHYYAMQFIEGQTLAALIEELRGAGAGDPAVSTRSYPPNPLQRYPGPHGRPGKSTAPLDDPSTDRSTVDAAQVRTVARLGIQAADALDYAHQVGIIHRDIKPSNLLLDERGNVWVTDFGLAHCQSDVSLTLTGDLIGTLRYMSPEQARAGRLPLDHRTDVYSLGATLYELLTLRPAVDGEDREEILSRIVSEDPPPLRRHNRTVPRELEVIVHKALAKAPEERYATAGEMADDLRRFLDDRPIRARPPGMGRRLLKWTRRHRALAVSVAGILVVSLALIGGVLGWLAQRRNAAAAAATEYIHRAELLQEQGHWDEAREALTRAEERLAADGPEALRRRVHRLRDDLDWVVDLEEAQSKAAEAREGLTWDYPGAEQAYRRAFARRGLDVEAMDAEEAAGRIRALSIRAPLIHALDNWAFAREQARPGDGEHLLVIAGRADDDPWRQKLRDLRPWDDRAALERLASDPAALDQPEAELAIVCLNLQFRGGAAASERLLRQAQAHRPGDFWLNFLLANVLASPGPKAEARRTQSIGFYRAAVAMRPKNSALWINLGAALGVLGRNDEAEQAFRKVLELRGEFAPAYSNLGSALAKQQRMAEAEAACRKAIALQPDYPEAHNNLGNVLSERGQLPAAEEELRRALAILPDHPEAHFSLGIVLGKQGKAAEAEKEFRLAVKLRPDSAEAHCNLGLSCQQQGKLEEALAAERKAIALRRSYPEAWFNLANVLLARKEPREAEEALRQAIAYKPDFTSAYFNLGLLLQDTGRPEEAERAFRKAILAQPNHVRSYLALAWNLKGREQFAAAARCYTDAFAAEPAVASNSENGLRFLAACCAARAGCGQGRDAGALDAAGRIRLRRQAFDWLRADLRDGRHRIESDPDPARPAVAERMRQWLKEPALDGVRRREALAPLSEEERRDWQQLWQEIEQLSRVDPDDRPA